VIFVTPCPAASCARWKVQGRLHYNCRHAIEKR
jgi:hypothetical protein